MLVYPKLNANGDDLQAAPAQISYARLANPTSIVALAASHENRRKRHEDKKVSSVFWGWLYSENRAPRAKIQQKEAPLACTVALTQYRAEEGFAALFHSVFDHAYWKKASAAPARSFFRPPDRRLALVLLNQ